VVTVTTSTTNPRTTATPEPAAPVPVGLVERAVHAARAYHVADPDGFVRRHGAPDQWNRWHAVPVSPAPSPPPCRCPVDSVFVTDDPHRTYRTRTGPVPRDLITVTDPATGRAWRFIPDHATPGDDPHTRRQSPPKPSPASNAVESST
jgi:hypothetical protein